MNLGYVTAVARERQRNREFGNPADTPMCEYIRAPGIDRGIVIPSGRVNHREHE